MASLLDPISTLTNPLARPMNASEGQEGEVCPICKTVARRKLNANDRGLTFLVSNKCYHRICSSCVDRKFTSGKTQCPIAGCQNMLWKRDWRPQVFEDLKVQREIDLRKRVFTTLDLANLGVADSEESFESKREYDDYLELKEEFAMNLVFNTDVVNTQKLLKDFETKNKEAGVKTRGKEARYPDASRLIKGLKLLLPAPVEEKYDAFLGMVVDREYFSLPTRANTIYDEYRTKITLQAGGYDFDEYVDESLWHAFAGLGVFVSETKQNNSGIDGMGLTAQIGAG